MSTPLQGKTVIVTGAAAGVGYAVAKKVSAAGATVVATDRTEEGLNAVRADIEAAGGRCSTVTVDLLAAGFAAPIVEAALTAGGEIDGIVHVAGLYVYKLIEDTDEELFDRIVGVNCKAPLMLTRAAVPHMPSPSSIVQIGSGTVALPGGGVTAYVASKGAVTSMTKALVSELSPRGIRVNTLAPGWVDHTNMTKDVLSDPNVLGAVTQMIPSGRVSEPDDVADVAVFLLSEASAHVHGAYLAVDGGASGALPSHFDPVAALSPKGN